MSLSQFMRACSRKPVVFLSIFLSSFTVQGLAEAHGGKFLLLDSEPTGLIARLELPIRVDFKHPQSRATV